MKKPVIGISCYGRGKIPDRYSVPIDYVSAVQRAGAHAVLLPPGDPSVLETVQGLVLCGGGDIDPKLYGAQERHPTLYGLDEERDAFELALAKDALSRHFPTLAICRGMQLVNVVLGGDLHQHLEDLPSCRPHRGKDSSITHTVTAEPGSLLARVAAEKTFEVCSEHHQAAHKLGQGLAVSARAEDGTIEALESKGHPRLLAVQWHPEDTAARDPVQQRLFDWLVGEARR